MRAIERVVLRKSLRFSAAGLHTAQIRDAATRWLDCIPASPPEFRGSEYWDSQYRDFKIPPYGHPELQSGYAIRAPIVLLSRPNLRGSPMFTLPLPRASKKGG